MALRDRIIEIAYRLKDQFSGRISPITNSFKRVSDQSKQTADRIELDNKRSSKSFFTLANAIRGLAAGAIGREFLQSAKDLEQLRLSLEVVTGSSEEAAEEIEFLNRVTQELGAPAREASKGYIGLAAATKGTALEGEETRKIFTSVVRAMTLLGKSSDDTAGVLRAFQQIVSKGTVQSEELRGQIGERLPGAFQLAARAIGVTTEELGDLLKSGSVTAEDLLPKLADELNKIGDSDQQINTITASFNRFLNLLRGSLQAINDSTGALGFLGRALSAVGSIIGSVTVGLGTLSESFKALGRNIGAFFDLVVNDLNSTGYERFLKRIEENNQQAEQAVADLADRIFDLDSNLKVAIDESAKFAKQTEETTVETDKFSKAVSGSKEQLDAISGASRTATSGLLSTSAALENARKTAEETKKEFSDLVDEISSAGDEDEPSSLDVFDAISRAQEALRNGDADKSLEILREGGEVLKQLKEEGEVAGISLQDMARSLQRVADEAADAQTSDEIFNFESAQKQLQDLLIKQQEIAGNKVTIDVEVDDSELENLSNFTPEPITVPIEFGDQEDLTAQEINAEFQLKTDEAKRKIEELKEQALQVADQNINVKADFDTTEIDEFVPPTITVPVRFVVVGGVPTFSDSVSRESDKRGFRP